MLRSSSNIKDAISKKQLRVSKCACVIAEMMSHHYTSSARAAILSSTAFRKSFFTNDRQISGNILKSKGVSNISVKGYI